MCDRCCEILATAATINATGDMQLTIFPQHFWNAKKYCLKIEIPFPIIAPGTNPALVLFDGTNLYPILNKIGNTARVYALQHKKSLSLVFGADAPHFQSLCERDIDVQHCVTVETTPAT